MKTMDWVALSIRQPWIDLILKGTKNIEVRPWKISRTGPILLHAALGVDWRAAELFCYREPLALPRGCLVGYAEITDSFEFNRERWLVNAERHLVMHPLLEGYYGAVLENVRAFKAPVRCRGRLFFFPVPEDILISTKRQLEQLQVVDQAG